MKSNNYLQTALQIIKKHRPVFEALAEYDTTHKLRKTNYRERINLTINGDLLKQFKQYAQEKNLNMSRVVERYMIEELKREKKKEA